MSTLEKLVAEGASIYKAEQRLRKRKARLEKNLEAYRGDLAIVDDVVYQVRGCDKLYIVKVGHMP